MLSNCVNEREKFSKENKHKESYKNVENAIETEPENASAYIRLGCALRSIKKHKKACEKFEKAIQIEPENTKAYIHLGYALRSIKKHEEACEKFEKAIQIEPKNLIAHVGLGYTLQNMEKYKEACKKFEQAIKIEPKNPTVYVDLGYALQSMKKHAEARKKFEKAIQIDPKNSAAHLGLGYSLRSMEKHEEACEKFEQAIALRPHYVNAYFALGISLQSMEKHEEACKKFEQATKINSKNVDTYFFWGQSLQKLGKHTDALQKIRNSIENYIENSIEDWNNKESISNISRFKPINTFTLHELNDNEIFLNNPNNFNDPLECLNLPHEIKNELVIASFSGAKEPYKNDSMWGYYAKSHSGICIEYEIDINKLKNTALCKVNYKEKLFLYEFEGLFSQKTKSWEHEKEYRLIHLLDKQANKGTYLKLEDLGMTIKRITFGFKTTKEDIELITKIIPKGIQLNIMKIENGSLEIKNYGKS